MGRLTRALIDTSILIEHSGQPELELPERAAISVISLGELRAGVLRARDAKQRAARQARLVAVRAAFRPLPIDERVADGYGEALAAAREHRRTAKASDLLIIATAATTGRTLYTLDRAQASLAALLKVPVEPASG